MPEAVCGSSDVTFALNDPNQDPIQWEAKMNTADYGNVDPISGTETSGTTVETKFKTVARSSHRHRVILTVTARDDKGNEAEPVEIEFFVFYPC